jgi:hypothetical protein
MRTIQGDEGVSGCGRSFQEVVNAGPGLVPAGIYRLTTPLPGPPARATLPVPAN